MVLIVNTNASSAWILKRIGSRNISKSRTMKGSLTTFEKYLDAFSDDVTVTVNSGPNLLISITPHKDKIS